MRKMISKEKHVLVILYGKDEGVIKGDLCPLPDAKCCIGIANCIVVFAVISLFFRVCRKAGLFLLLPAADLKNIYFFSGTFYASAVFVVNTGLFTPLHNFLSVKGDIIKYFFHFFHESRQGFVPLRTSK